MLRGVSARDFFSRQNDVDLIPFGPFGWICRRMTGSTNMRLQLPPNEGMGSPPNRSFYVIWDHFEKCLKFPETKRHEVKTKEQQQRISFGSVKHQTQKGESPDSTVSICELMYHVQKDPKISENLPAGWIEFVFLNSGAKASFLQNIVLAEQLHDV